MIAPLPAFGSAGFLDRLTQYFQAAPAGCFQTNYLTQQGGFTAAGCTHQSEYFAVFKTKTDILMNQFFTEISPNVLKLHGARSFHGNPTFLKRMENMESITITTVMVVTTACVVSSPRLSVFGLIRKP